MKKIVIFSIGLFALASLASCGHQHEFKHIIENPNCYINGLEYDKCEKCGAIENQNTIDPIGHNLENKYVFANQEVCYLEFCTLCDYSHITNCRTFIEDDHYIFSVDYTEVCQEGKYKGIDMIVYSNKAYYPDTKKIEDVSTEKRIIRNGNDMYEDVLVTIDAKTNKATSVVMQKYPSGNATETEIIYYDGNYIISSDLPITYYSDYLEYKNKTLQSRIISYDENNVKTEMNKKFSYDEALDGSITIYDSYKETKVKSKDGVYISKEESCNNWYAGIDMVVRSINYEGDTLVTKSTNQRTIVNTATFIIESEYTYNNDGFDSFDPDVEAMCTYTSKLVKYYDLNNNLVVYYTCDHTFSPYSSNTNSNYKFYNADGEEITEDEMYSIVILLD